MLGIGSTELLVILVVALIVLGPKNLPRIAQTLGKAMGEFRRYSTEFQRTLNTEIAFEEHKKEQAKADEELTQAATAKQQAAPAEATPASSMASPAPAAEATPQATPDATQESPANLGSLEIPNPATAPQEVAAQELAKEQTGEQI